MTKDISYFVDKSEKVLTQIGWRDTREADTILLTARAQLHLLTLDRDPKREKLVREQLAYLESIAKINTEQAIGWGKDGVFDTFGKGSPNPTTTVYSYTTAAAALAYLDAYVVLQDRAYLHIAEKAAHALLVNVGLWKKDGYLSVWYSDQEADHRDAFQCHNVSALALAALARLDRYNGNDKYAKEIKGLLQCILDDQGLGYNIQKAGSPFNWRYCRLNDSTNDLLHEAFILEGLLEVGTWEASVAALKSFTGMWFVNCNIDATPRFDLPSAQGSLGWGLPCGLYAFASVDYFFPQAAIFAEGIGEAIGKNGEPLRLAPQNDVIKGDEILRAYGWYALSLARFAVLKSGRKELLPPSIPKIA
ncbi:MAG: hypothetical protein IT583_00220 [Verrucomicrobia bacterium]|nr:hypothetical protein [Verrucomicrobiota bacterium]